MQYGGGMFGHDKDNDDHDTVQPTSDNDQGSSAPPPMTLDSLDPPTSSDNSSSSAPTVQPDATLGDDAPPTITTHAPGAGDTDELLNIKQQALQQLSPLVDHLDQTAEEKFRTTMMMIQASDDQSLISTAYDAAKKITDEKVRAQALLDIVNEINYFTQQANNN